MTEASVQQQLSRVQQPGIVLGRHEVGLAIAAALNPFTLHGVEPAVYWLATFLGAQAFAVAGASLALLFFTKREQGKFLSNFVMLAWAVTALVLAGQWIGLR